MKHARLRHLKRVYERRERMRRMDLETNRFVGGISASITFLTLTKLAPTESRDLKSVLQGKK